MQKKNEFLLNSMISYLIIIILSFAYYKNEILFIYIPYIPVLIYGFIKLLYIINNKIYNKYNKIIIYKYITVSSFILITIILYDLIKYFNLNYKFIIDIISLFIITSIFNKYIKLIKI